MSTPKLSYGEDAPLFTESRAACTAGMVNWRPQASLPKKKPPPKKKHS